jgi:hypothetical protein
MACLISSRLFMTKGSCWTTGSPSGRAGGVLDRLVLAVAEVIGHLGSQRVFEQQFGELLEQSVLTNQVTWLPVISQKAVQQLLGYGFFGTVIIAPGNGAVSCLLTAYIRRILTSSISWFYRSSLMNRLHLQTPHQQAISSHIYSVRFPYIKKRR